MISNSFEKINRTFSSLWRKISKTRTPIYTYIYINSIETRNYEEHDIVLGFSILMSTATHIMSGSKNVCIDNILSTGTIKDSILIWHHRPIFQFTSINIHLQDLKLSKPNILGVFTWLTDIIYVLNLIFPNITVYLPYILAVHLLLKY